MQSPTTGTSSDLAEHASGKRGGRPIKGNGFQMQRPSHGPSSSNAWPHRACPDEGESAMIGDNLKSQLSGQEIQRWILK